MSLQGRWLDVQVTGLITPFTLIIRYLTKHLTPLRPRSKRFPRTGNIWPTFESFNGLSFLSSDFLQDSLIRMCSGRRNISASSAGYIKWSSIKTLHTRGIKLRSEMWLLLHGTTLALHSLSYIVQLNEPILSLPPIKCSEFCWLNYGKKHLVK